MTGTARIARTLLYMLGVAAIVAIAVSMYRPKPTHVPDSPIEPNTTATRATEAAVPASDRKAAIKPSTSEKTIPSRALRQPTHRDYPRAYTLKTVRNAEGSVLQTYQNLKPLADAGDTEAALQLFQATLRCIVLPGRNARNSTLDHIERDLNDCPGVGQEHFDEAFRRLLWAAENGNDEAQLEYAYSAFFQYSKPEEFLEHPNFVSDYRRNYVRFLEAAISQGNVTAIATLANSYRTGGEVDRDPFKAYAYEYAALTVRPNETRANLDWSAEQLTPEQIAAAQRLAAQIVKRCCE